MQHVQCLLALHPCTRRSNGAQCWGTPALQTLLHQHPRQRPWCHGLLYRSWCSCPTHMTLGISSSPVACGLPPHAAPRTQTSQASLLTGTALSLQRFPHRRQVRDDAWAGRYTFVYMTPELATSAGVQLTALHAGRGVALVAVGAVRGCGARRGAGGTARGRWCGGAVRCGLRRVLAEGVCLWVKVGHGAGGDGCGAVTLRWSCGAQVRRAWGGPSEG